MELCAAEAVANVRPIRSVRFDPVARNCYCFDDSLFQWTFDSFDDPNNALWLLDPDTQAEWYEVKFCEFVRPDVHGRTLVWSKNLNPPGQADGWCSGSPAGAGYVIQSGSVLNSYAQGQSAAPFDVLCKEKCEERSDCQSAHVFVETFEHHDLAHAKPPPPSPPSPPSPPPSPPPPATPFPPATPPQFGTPIRTFAPALLEVPAANAEGMFEITCAVDGCGAGLPIFKSSSQIAVVAKMQEMVESGVTTRSACAFECARAVTSHALDADTFVQLFTTSTLTQALFSYPRLSDKQQAVADVEGTDDANLGSTTAQNTASGYVQLNEIARFTQATMTECGEFMEDRKTIAMHAVWMFNHTEPGMLPTGDCVLFLAARDTFQQTLWQSFFEHARTVVDVPHFSTAVPSSDAVAEAVPRHGLDCEFGYTTPVSGESIDQLTDTSWRACLWWSEFTSDPQDELACSPDNDGGNIVTPMKMLSDLRALGIKYPPPSPPPPPPPPTTVSPPPPDENFQCAAGILPRAPSTTSVNVAKCWEWSRGVHWPPFAVHGDIVAVEAGGCRMSPPPSPPSPPPPPCPPTPRPPPPPPTPPPPPPWPPCQYWIYQEAGNNNEFWTLSNALAYCSDAIYTCQIEAYCLYTPQKYFFFLASIDIHRRAVWTDPIWTGYKCPDPRYEDLFFGRVRTANLADPACAASKYADINDRRRDRRALNPIVVDTGGANASALDRGTLLELATLTLRRAIAEGAFDDVDYVDDVDPPNATDATSTAVHAEDSTPSPSAAVNVNDMTRIVQWDNMFRQPSYGDAQSSAFTGPAIADCSDAVPDTHCCRHRTTFWVSKDENDARWFGNPSVTGCESVCGTQFLRTGHDAQCLPVQPECNDWYGADDPAFLYSDLVLLEAYCLCGMKLNVIPFSQRRQLQSYDSGGGGGATTVAATATATPTAATATVAAEAIAQAQQRLVWPARPLPESTSSPAATSLPPSSATAPRSTFTSACSTNTIARARSWAVAPPSTQR